ncbi:MAG: hypothetical protein M0Z50_05725 [Planctomycetia bacterium]|nr:hypothetical protein [Planctomycetia bacterium]
MSQEYLPFDLAPANNVHSIKTGELINIEKPALPAPQRDRDLIQEDETAAVLHALDHAFDASPPLPTGQRDLVHKDEQDQAWLNQKPWEKPATDAAKAAAQEIER